MMKRCAIIGYGGMGGYHHNMIRERLGEHLEVVGAYDVRLEQQEAAKAQGIRAYQTLQELLEDDSLDLVTIATPNNFHKALAIACLEHGKHVVCEKPVTMNTEELEDILAVAKKTGKLFTVHQNRRWDKDFVIVKKIVQEKLLGNVYAIESRVQGSKRSLEGWRGAVINGGGMVYDWGIHLLDQVVWMIDSPVTEVYAHLFEIFSKEVDDNFKVLLRFENGVSALIEVATNCFIPQARWHVACEDGTAVVEDWACHGKMIRLADDTELAWSNQIVYTEAGPTRTMAPRPRETTEEIPLPEVTSDWCDYYKNVLATMDGKEELIVKPEESLRVMKVVDTIFESHRLRKSISCRI